jgi:hypothetical protein
MPGAADFGAERRPESWPASPNAARARSTKVTRTAESGKAFFVDRRATVAAP